MTASMTAFRDVLECLAYGGVERVKKKMDWVRNGVGHSLSKPSRDKEAWSFA
jgi:hypothetical protein